MTITPVPLHASPQARIAAPVLVTDSGCRWVLRRVTSSGDGLYALEGAVADCPEWVMASAHDLIAGFGATAPPVDGPHWELRHVLDPNDVQFRELAGGAA